MFIDDSNATTAEIMQALLVIKDDKRAEEIHNAAEEAEWEGEAAEQWRDIEIDVLNELERITGYAHEQASLVI